MAGFEEMPPVFSPISGICTRVVDLEVRDIPEVRGLRSSPMLTSPSPILGGTLLVSEDLVGASS